VPFTIPLTGPWIPRAAQLVVRWLDAQRHSGENTGSSPTHVVFVELKENQSTERPGDVLDPSE
jgi:hypothetical protein